jgi:tRNA-dihydrouridine synthase B
VRAIAIHGRTRADQYMGEADPVSVQSAGADPAMMAQAARYDADNGAQIVDINMGCPAKKICNVMAGSALMQNEPLVVKILEAVVAAVPDTPVTLKFRTGWNRDNRNAPRIARIAEDSGIRAIAIHGRTRADQYMGCAEYDTIALVKSKVKIPVIANGDINTPQKARFVLDYTGADGVMIGRAAQGRPWLFREIEYFLATGEELPLPQVEEIHAILRGHLADLYAFYGELTGVRIARKHISWYTKGLIGAAHFRHAMNQLQSVHEQLAATDEFFLGYAAANDQLRHEDRVLEMRAA